MTDAGAARTADSPGLTLELVADTCGRGPERPKSGFDPSLEVDAVGARALSWVRRSMPNGTMRPQSLAWDLKTSRHLEGDWVALHPDGRLAIVRNGDELVVQEVDSGRVVSSLDPRLPSLKLGRAGRYGIAWSRQSARQDAHGTPQNVFDLEGGTLVHALPGPFLLCSPLPADEMVTVDERNTIGLWSLASGTELRRMKGPRDKPAELRIDPTRRRAHVLGQSGTLRVWDLASGDLVATNDGHARVRAGAPEFLRLLADGRLVSEGFFLDVLDPEAGVLDRSWMARGRNTDPFQAVEALGTGSLVAVSLLRGLLGPARLEIWDVDRRLLLGAVGTELARSLAVTDGDLLVVGFDDGVRAYRPRPGGPLPEQPTVSDADRKVFADTADETGGMVLTQAAGGAPPSQGAESAKRKPAAKRDPVAKPAAKRKASTKPK